MKKISFLLSTMFLFAGCSISLAPRGDTAQIGGAINIDLKEQIKLSAEVESTLKNLRQQKFSLEKISESELRFPLSAEIVEFSWGDPYRLLEIMKDRGLSFEFTKEIEFPIATYLPSLPEADVLSAYSLAGKTYTLISAGTNEINESYVLKEGENEVFRSSMCYGAEGPIIDIRLVEGNPAVTFSGKCIEDENLISAKRNIFHQGKTMNEEHGADESHYLFSYQGKLGFVTKKDNQEYIFFNGRLISSGYDSIITSSCCMTIAPLFKVYENGMLLFRALKNDTYYLVQIDLNTR